MVREIIAKSKKHGNKTCLVDDEDYERMAKFIWFVAKDRYYLYALRKARTFDGRRTSISMHREILGFPNSIVDHKDHDGLNNQKANLRLATPSQNGVNAKMHINNKSGYRGVSWCKINNKWRTVVGKRSVGYYNTKEEAARAYDEVSKEEFGEFAVTNFETGISDCT